jgi:hypothetical protein
MNRGFFMLPKPRIPRNQFVFALPCSSCQRVGDIFSAVLSLQSQDSAHGPRGQRRMTKAFALADAHEKRFNGGRARVFPPEKVNKKLKNLNH